MADNDGNTDAIKTKKLMGIFSGAVGVIGGFGAEIGVTQIVYDKDISAGLGSLGLTMGLAIVSAIASELYVKSKHQEEKLEVNVPKYFMGAAFGIAASLLVTALSADDIETTAVENTAPAIALVSENQQQAATTLKLEMH